MKEVEINAIVTMRKLSHCRVLAVEECQTRAAVVVAMLLMRAEVEEERSASAVVHPIHAPSAATYGTISVAAVRHSKEPFAAISEALHVSNRE